MSSSSWGLCCVALARQTCVRFPLEDLYCCCGRLRLEAHPLAHASGWDLSGGGGGGASARAPSLGGRKWQKENDKLEKQLEDMSDSVNQMFSDQKNKKRYRRDEDRLFNQVRHVTGCVRAGRIRAPSNAVNARPEPL